MTYFEFGVSQIFGVAVLAFRGEIDLANSTRFAESLATVPSEPTVIVSLQEVDYIDSSGLTALTREDQRRQRSGSRLLIVLPGGQAARVFELSGLDKVLACYGGMTAAIEAAACHRDGVVSPWMHARP